MKRQPQQALFERFPQLARLNVNNRRARIPVVRQLAAADCGAAALAMTLRYHGKYVSLDEMRNELNPGRDGTTAEAILRVARRYQLNGQGVRLELEAFRDVAPGTILFWEFRHFVVFERMSKDSFTIADPAFGRRTISSERMHRSVTGVALLFRKTDTFTRSKGPSERPLELFHLIFERRDLFSRVVSAALFSQVAVAIVPLLLASVIDRVIPHHDSPLLFAIAIGFVSLESFAVLATFIRSQVLIYLRVHTEVTFALRFLDHLLELPYSFFQQHTSGDLTVRLNSNSSIREILTSTALSALLDGTTAGIYVLLLLLADVKMTLVIVALAALQIAVLAIFRLRKRRLLAELLDNQAASQTYQVEMITGMETLKAMGLERSAASRWTDIFIDGLNASTSSSKLDALFAACSQCITFLSTLFLTFYGAYLVLHDEISLGTMIAFSALAIGFLQPLGNLASAVLQLQTVQVYLSRLNDVMRTAPEEDPGSIKPAGLLSGSIALSRLAYRYSPTSPAILKGISGEIQAGTRIGIVGKSGCGKSTLVRLLAGLYHPTRGTIRFDEWELASTEKRSIRKQIGFVAQESQLFAGSIRHNILLGQPEIGIEAMIWGSRIAALHDDVLAMPMGYETMLADRGASMSGGQRQRLALARALARRPAILILDEATSHLDAITEQLVTHNLKVINATVILVAHRLSTIRDCDEIWVVDGGKVVERGTHESLLARGNHYAALIEAQLPNETKTQLAPEPAHLVGSIREPL